jgi:hypothetical protein
MMGRLGAALPGRPELLRRIVAEWEVVMSRYENIQKRKQERQVWRELPAGSRVVIYGRHSPGESQSIDSQADAMRRWVEFRGWVAVREFYDEGIEGSRSDRQAFQDLLSYLNQQPRPVEGVVTWNTSRFGRDQLDSQFYKAHLRRQGYAILGKEDGIDQSPLAPVLESMLEWKAQQDLAVISTDSKRGLEYLARRGFWPGGFLPVGFAGEKVLIGHRKNGDPRYGITVKQDEAVAERIRRAWEMRLAGDSYLRIQDKVRLYSSSKCYNHFFDNALYAGLLDYGGQRYPEGWREGARFCQPYITVEEYEEVQRLTQAQRMQAHTIGPYATPRNRVSTFLLSGLIICGKCLEERGEEVTLIGWHDLRRSSGDCYRCGRKVRLGGGACTLRYVSCRLLERTVAERIREEIFTPEYIRAEVAQANALLAQRHSAEGRMLREAEAAELAARNAVENLGAFIAGHGANAIIEAQYAEADRAWRAALAAVAAAKAEQREHARPMRITEREAAFYAANLVEHLYDGDIALRRMFLASVIKRIVVFDEEGAIELVDQPATQALRTLNGEIGGNGEKGAIARYLPGYASDALLRGSPLGVPRLFPRFVAASTSSIMHIGNTASALLVFASSMRNYLLADVRAH